MQTELLHRRWLLPRPAALRALLPRESLLLPPSPWRSLRALLRREQFPRLLRAPSLPPARVWLSPTRTLPAPRLRPWRPLPRRVHPALPAAFLQRVVEVAGLSRRRSEEAQRTVVPRGRNEATDREGLLPLGGSSERLNRRRPLRSLLPGCAHPRAQKWMLKRERCKPSRLRRRSGVSGIAERSLRRELLVALAAPPGVLPRRKSSMAVSVKCLPRERRTP